MDKIKMESRRYAKRQLSWFKRGNIYWLAPRDDIADRAQAVIRGELL
ncbi:MAG: hypothetical protein Q8873_09555 [Bacillota bacterium]|nr:hypothetical protein [Bacillota bacterium]